MSRVLIVEDEEAIAEISIDNRIVIFCQTGKRSLAAVKMLTEKFPACMAYSLQGGVEAWKKHCNKSLHSATIKS